MVSHLKLGDFVDICLMHAGAKRAKSLGSLGDVLRAYAHGTIFGESYGEGPVRVVWLHGWGRSGSDFAQSASVLALKGVASISLDFPGFGSSPAPSQAGGARLYAELISPALREIAEGPVVLVGHSFGGRVASVIASEYPELVAGVLFTGAPLVRRKSGGKSPFKFRVIKKARALGLVSEARLERARRTYGSLDYRTAQGIMRDVLVATVNESYESELAKITQPVRALWGANDRDVPTEIAERSLSLIPGPHHLRVLSGVGHLVPTTAPNELAAETELLVK